MSTIALRWLAGLAVFAGVFAGVFAAGYWRGDVARDNAWMAQNLQTERAAAKKYQAEVVRGDKAAGAYAVESQALQTQFIDLTEKFHALRKRIPLVAKSAARVPGGDASFGRAGARSAPPPVQPAAAGRDDSVDAGPALTAGAVWMWNSALAGADQPAGACGALDPTAPACAVETSITLDEAWDNHGANAEICAGNRLAHQRLIDFLHQREAGRP